MNLAKLFSLGSKKIEKPLLRGWWDYRTGRHTMFLILFQDSKRMTVLNNQGKLYTDTLVYDAASNELKGYYEYD